MKDFEKILGMKIHREIALGRLLLSQNGYIRKVLERFSLKNVKPISTPLANHFRLSAT